MRNKLLLGITEENEIVFAADKTTTKKAINEKIGELLRAGFSEVGRNG